MYCEKCCRIIEEKRCPFCNSRRVRVPEPTDLCFLTEQGYVSTGILEDVLKQNQIHYLTKGALGAGLAIRVGPVLEWTRFYVPYEQWEEARTIVDDLFAPVEESPDEDADESADESTDEDTDEDTDK